MGRTIITTIGTGKTKKVCFFDADRDLSNRVSEFMRCKVWHEAIKLEYQKKINEIHNVLDSYAKLKGSILENSVDTEALFAQIAILEQTRDEYNKEHNRFSLSDIDKEFKKALKKAEGDTNGIADAVVGFFAHYNLDVSNSYFLYEILDTFGYKVSVKQFVATNATDARILDVNAALQLLYASTYTHMLRVGTIKPTQIPEIVREKYAPKKDKKNKK